MIRETCLLYNVFTNVIGPAMWLNANIYALGIAQERIIGPVIHPTKKLQQFSLFSFKEIAYQTILSRINHLNRQHPLQELH